MKIFANIDDCALAIDDFLPTDLFNKIKSYNYFTHKKHTNFDSWEKNLYADSDNNVTMAKVQMVGNVANLTKGKYKYNHKIFKEVLKTIKNCKFIPFQFNSSISISYYNYEKYAGINWHDDGDFTLNYSLYIHEDWDKNWGGENLINTGRGLPLSVEPKPNRLLAVKNKIQHKVCAITGPINREVLQIRGVFYE